MASLPAIVSPWRLLDSTDIDGRPIYFASIPTIAAAMDLPLPEGRFFKLFLASEVAQQTGDLSFEFAKRFVFAGCCYMCAWGESCGMWDDDFDYAVVIPRVEETHEFGYPDDERYVHMTSWFDGETLDYARAFFCRNAHPTAGFAPNCPVCFAIAIGDDRFADEVVASLLKGREQAAE